MITALLRIVGRGESRPLLIRYVASTTLYALSEGAAFGLLVPLLGALLEGDTGAAARDLLPLACAVLVGWFAQYDMGLRALALSSAWRRTLHARIGAHAVRLPLGWFDGPRTGQLERLIGPGVATVASTPHLAQALIGAVLTPVTIFVFLLCYDWRVAVAVLITVPVVLLVFRVARRLTERTDAEHDAAAARAAGRLVEFAGAQPVLRAGGAAAGGRRDLDEALAAQHLATRRQVVGALPGLHLGQLAIQLAFTAVLVVGLILADGGEITPARAVALLVLGVHFLQPLAVVAGAAGALHTTRAAVERVDAFLSVPPLPEPAAPAPLRQTPPAVELSGVRFGYEPGEPVLDGLDLTVPPGATVALVGASGAGKTTVTKLIARFFDVDEGTVRIGGTDVRELGTEAVLDTVSLVFQDVHLLDTTIEENIRLGRPGASDAQVRDAARRARVDTIVERLPDGWASRVGEGGGLLSGGERQRVAIARALLKDTPVVLLDEATSALDAENEAAVREALAELGEGRALLIIAHRLATVADADEIVVLDAGRVAERGTHAALVAAGGRYAQLWAAHEKASGWRLGADA